MNRKIVSYKKVTNRMTNCMKTITTCLAVLMVKVVTQRFGVLLLIINASDISIVSRVTTNVVKEESQLLQNKRVLIFNWHDNHFTLDLTAYSNVVKNLIQMAFGVIWILVTVLNNRTWQKG